jgi:hypothetical protein
MKSQMPGKLNTQVPEPADTLHRHQIAPAQASIAKSVVGCDARAEERSGFRGIQFIRNGSEGARFSDHHFGISSIYGYPKGYGVLAIHHVPASAWFADTVFAGDQADANALTHLPFGHSAAESFDAANDFVPRNARESETRVSAHNRGRIRVTYSAGLDADSNLARSGLRYRPFDDSKHSWC